MKPGDRVEGYYINAEGEDVRCTGVYLFRTNDPEEYIQDIVIRLDEGQSTTSAIQYCDEQDVRLLT
jgi:hypothetical protein